MLCHKNLLSKCGYCIYSNIAKIHTCVNEKIIVNKGNNIRVVSNIDTEVISSLYFNGLVGQLWEKLLSSDLPMVSFTPKHDLS